MNIRHKNHINYSDLRASRIPGAFLGLIMILFLVPSCSVFTPPPLETRSVSLYNPGKTDMHPDYTVYHSGESESTLFFRVFCRELLFNQANPENEIRARIRIDYKLYSSYIDQKLESSGSEEFTINRAKDRDVYFESMKLLVEEGKSYFLELTLTDLQRERSKIDYVFVDRFSELSQQNYLVLSYPSNEIGFERFYYPDERFRIITRKNLSGRMQVSYYKPVRVLPPPPFHTNEIVQQIPAADSIWEVNYDQQTLFEMDKKGIYQYYLPNDKINSLYLTNLGDHFPNIQSADDMAPPLQYITTSEEYQKIISQADLKKAIDEFWVKIGKDYDNARELIKVYYNRVLFANLYYSTDREGWKTDRGMIYLLMGPPAMVKKTETKEEWNYQTQDNRHNYRFDFILESDPIKVYDFVLSRSENHRNVWNAAVQTWRNGRIFSL